MSSGYQISHARLGIDRSDPDLVAGWEMNQRIAGQVDDVSGHITGLLVGNIQQRHCLLGPYINFNGVDQRVNISGFAEVTTDLSFNFWVRSTSATSSNYLFYSRSTAGGIFDLAIAWSHNGKLAVYDGAWRDFDNTPNDGHWHHIVFILDKTALTARCYVDTVQSGSTQTYTPQILGTTASLCSNSAGNAGFFDGDLLNTSFCDCVQDTNWVQTQYNRGCLALFQTKSVPTTGTISSGWIGESPFRVESGSFKIVSDITDNRKVAAIECVTTGVFYMPTSILRQSPKEAAYGEWIFSAYKSGTTILYAYVVASTVTGGANYRLIWQADEQLDLRRGSSLIIDGGFVAADEPHEFKITRKSNNEFEMFADGVSQGTVIDANFTESTYISFSLSPGDRIYCGAADGYASLIKRLLP